MFTGIIEEVGRIERMEKSAAGARIRVAAEKILSDLEIGGSIAVNGCCLTAVEIDPAGFEADLSPETLEKTSLGGLQTGSSANLERPLSPSGRLSGHFVQGHVDAAGELVSLEEVGDGNWLLSVRVPRELLHYLVYKGSIALDGVSLTIARLDDDVVRVAIIPHTYQETAFRLLRPGARVNVECDMIAKHVARLLERIDAPGARKLDLSKLRKEGF